MSDSRLGATHLRQTDDRHQSILSDDDLTKKLKYHNSISSCFNPYPGFQDANLRIMFCFKFL